MSKKQRLRWERGKGCGGATIYIAVLDDTRICHVENDGLSPPEWRIYFPASKKWVDGIATLREAKAIVFNIVSPTRTKPHGRPVVFRHAGKP